MIFSWQQIKAVDSLNHLKLFKNHECLYKKNGLIYEKGLF